MRQTIELNDYIKRVNSLKAGEWLSVTLGSDGYIITAFANMVKGSLYRFMMIDGFYGNCEMGCETFDEQGILEYLEYVKALDPCCDEEEDITIYFKCEGKPKRKVAVFYPVTNNKDYDRYSMKYEIHDTDILAKLSEVDDVRIYDLERLDWRTMSLLDFEEDYNNEELDGGWWVKILEV